MIKVRIQEWPTGRGLTRVCCLCTAAAILAPYVVSRHLKGNHLWELVAGEPITAHLLIYASHAYFNKAFWYIESCSSPHLFWLLLFDELSPKYVTAKFLVTAGSFAIKLHCSRPGSTSVWYYVFIFNCSSDLEYAFPVFSSLLQLLKHPRGLLLPLPARPSQFLTVQCNNINQHG